MTVAGHKRPPTRLEIAKQHVEHALGPKIAKRLDTHKDGTFYISAGGWARLSAWFVDVLVVVLCAVGGAVVVEVAKPETPSSTVGLTALGLLVGVPVLYGFFYGNGRVLGGLLTGTRLVRVKNGQRIGAGACWAMVVRIVLFPLLLCWSLAAAASGAGSGLPGDLTRISIDEKATRRLHAAGFLRLDASSSAT
jgi:hypothetical protein